jgi:hypothetical protein
MSEKTIEVNWNDAADDHEEMLEEGKRNVKMGVGVGVFGAGSLALIGATCPLCFFVAPAMVGVGMWKTRKAKQAMADCQAADSQVADSQVASGVGESDGDGELGQDGNT